MAKDPAFLFYPKDWLQGTSKMMPDEKGIYIDLLAHQHQDGSIPNDTKRLARMVGLSELEFLPIWEGVKYKFKPAELNHLVNQKLREVVTKRSTNSRTKKISGSFAAVVRLSKAPTEIKEQIKKEFNINNFCETTDDLLNQHLTTWFNSRWKSIATINVNENEIVLEGGVGETNLVNDAEKEILKSEIWFQELLMNKGKTIADGKELLRNFHLYMVQNQKYPQTKKQLCAGFERWLLNEKKFNNGTHQQHTSGSGGKLGTSAARNQAAKDF